MAGKIEKLEARVRELYAHAHKDPARADWAGWLGKYHVPQVADYATELARRHGGKAEVARAAALLHDIADVKMAKRGKEHEAESVRLARELMEEAGFGSEEIEIVAGDALPNHSCHGDERPETIEGKILATADSMAHLKTDFYVHATWAFGGERPLADVKAWTLEKIERDLKVKTFFADVREELRPDYDLLKELYSR